MKKILFIFLQFYISTLTAQRTTGNYLKSEYRIDVSYATGFFHELQYLGWDRAHQYGMGWSKFNHCVRFQFSDKNYLGHSGNNHYGLNVILGRIGFDLYQHGGLAGLHLGILGIGFAHLTEFTEDSGLEFDLSIHTGGLLVRGLGILGIEAQLILGINYQYKNLVVGFEGELFTGISIGAYGSNIWGGLAGLKIGYLFRKKR
ncbi:MAG: hypothetical protein GY810_30050 [Aureispira sp.]|nr:hypothetical protein [Aureispira sp.]